MATPMEGVDVGGGIAFIFVTKGLRTALFGSERAFTYVHWSCCQHSLAAQLETAILAGKGSFLDSSLTQH